MSKNIQQKDDFNLQFFFYTGHTLILNKCYNKNILTKQLQKMRIQCMKNSRKQAQSLIEYGLILALVAIVALTTMAKLGDSVKKTGTNVGNQLDTSSTNAMKNYCESLTPAGTYSATTGQCLQ